MTLIATENFIVGVGEYAGEEILAGITRIDDNHEIVKRYPQAFRVEVSGRKALPRGVARAAPPPDLKSPGTRGDELPRLSTLPRYSVRISAAAAYGIDWDLGETDDGRESGGGLFGYGMTADGILVDDITGPGSDAQRSYGSMKMDWERHLRIERAWQCNGYPGRLLGCWHTHPDGGLIEPSDSDLRTWGCAIDKRLGAVTGGIFVGVLLGRTSAVAPLTWRAWTVEVRDGTTVCEPAHLDVGGY